MNPIAFKQLSAAQFAAVQALVSGAGISAAAAASTYRDNIRRGTSLVQYPRSAADFGAITGQSGNTPTVTYTTRDNIPVARVTTVAGFFGTVNFLAFSKSIPLGRMHALIYIDSPSTLSTINFYLATEVGVTNFFIGGVNMGNTGRDNGSAGFPGWYLLTLDPPATGTYAGLAADGQQRRWAIGGGTPDFATGTFTTGYLRLQGQTGVPGTIEIAGVWVNEYNSLPAIVLTADDGYASWYEIGLPIAEKYGLRMSQGVIGRLPDTNVSYATLAQLKQAVARGHECYTHGDPVSTGNLAQYSTAAEVAADIASNKAFLVANGLTRNGSENLYAYPQGVYQISRTDTTIQQGLDLAGITYARTATLGNGAGILTNLHANKMRRYLPIIGHSWTNEPAEAANISRLVLRMQEMTAQGRSCMLMVHKFIAGAGPAANQIEISANNWETICAAIAVEVDAGRARNLLWSEFAAEMDAAAT